MKAQLKDHMENHKFFDTIKGALAKNPELSKMDRQKIIDTMVKEGVMDDLISSLPLPKTQKAGGVNAFDVSGSDSLGPREA